MSRCRRDVQCSNGLLRIDTAVLADDLLKYLSRVCTYPTLNVDPQPSAGTLCDLSLCLGGDMNSPTLRPSEDRLSRPHECDESRLTSL